MAVRRKQANHRAVIAECKSKPGEWVFVNLYRSLYVARSTCQLIEGCCTHPKIVWYKPEAPDFEAEYRMHEDGWEVYARYVGEEVEQCASTASPSDTGASGSTAAPGAGT